MHGCPYCESFKVNENDFKLISVEYIKKLMKILKGEHGEPLHINLLGPVNQVVEGLEILHKEEMDFY